jgi:hypothetical protein
MGEWLLSRRDSTIVARHEVPGDQQLTDNFALACRRWRKQHLPEGAQDDGTVQDK